MADTITVKFKVTEDGSLKQVTNESKKAAKGLDNVSNSARNADRNLKGAAQASSNGTKNFSKMAQGTGGLVAAYATLAANIFAISAAYGFLKRAGDLVALTKGQEAYALKTGRSMKLLTSRMQEATGGLLGFDEASQAAAIGTAAGLSSDQLQGLAKLAKNASVALGRDLTDSFNRLTKGAIKAEPELLDELGIILRLEKASADYARVLGKNVDELTTFEKSQGIVNAVLQQGNDKFDDVGDNVNQIARLGKAFDDLVKSLMKFIEPFASFFAEALADNVRALAAAFGILGLSITRALAPAPAQFANISTMAEHSKQALMGAAGTGITGKKIAGGDFSTANLNAIDKGSGLKSGKSSVVDQMKMTEKEFKTHTAVIRADHARMVAANTRGFGKYYADFIAYLRGMEAEHGKTMGRIKAAGAVMASGLGKVLNAVAIVGMLSLAITMVKEFIEYFKDPALKKMETNARSLQSAYQDQNVEIKKMLADLELSKTFSESLTQQANMLGNQAFPGIKAMAENLEGAKLALETIKIGDGGGYVGQMVTTTTAQEPGNIGVNLGALQEFAQSLKIQLDMLKSFGLESEEITAQREKYLAIESAIATVATEGRSKPGATDEERLAAIEAYNDGVTFLKQNLSGAREGAVALSTSLAPDAAAITDIKEASLAFEKFRDGLNHAQSSYNTFIQFGNRFADQLDQLENKSEGTSIGTALTTAEVASFESFLGLKTEEEKKTFKTLTLLKAKEKVEERIKAVRSAENIIEKGILETKTKHLQALRGASKIETAVLNAKNKVALTNGEINKIESKITHEKSLGVKQDSTAIAKLEEQVRGLKAKRNLEQDIANTKVAQQEIEQSIFDLNTSGELTKAKEALLSLEEKSLKIAQEKEALAQKDRDRATTQAKRGFKQGSPFSSLFQGKFDAKIELAQAVKEREEKVIALEAERKMKEDLIEMEYTLLDAKLMQLQLEMQLKAKDPNLKFDQQLSFAIMGKKVEASRAKIPGMKAGALANATAAETSGIADIDEGIAALADKKRDLEDIQVLTKGIAESLSSGMSQAFADMATGAKSAKQAFADMAKSILSNIASMIAEMLVMQMIKGMFGLSFEGGGVMKEGKKVPSYSTGGIARGSSQGHPAILHGTEAVVPLPNGKSIPVEMKSGGGTNNNIVVNVSSDGKTSTQGSTGPDMDRMGKAIAAAVQTELQNQKRSGGILNPYGVA